LCSAKAHGQALQLIEGVCSVYAAQGLRVGGGEAALSGDDERAPAVGSESESGEQMALRPGKRQRRHSISSTERAMQGFASVMSNFAPPPPPRALTAADWFAKLSATDEQIAAVKAKLPAAAGEPSTLLMSGFDDGMLAGCGFIPLQIVAWKKLAAAQPI
jgi:hypothetical protein